MKSRSTPHSSATAKPFRRTVLLILATALVAILAAAILFLRPWDDATGPDTGSTAAPRPVDSFYLPAEFQAQEHLLLAGTQLAELHPDVLADIVGAVTAEVGVSVLVGSAADRSLVETILADRSLPPDALDIIELPIRSMWVRDFGPQTVSDADGRRSMVKFHYRERRGNTLDDGVSAHIATRLGLNLLSRPLLAEGGDYLSNGRGLCLLSNRVINRNAHYLDMEPEQTMAAFANILGFETLSTVPPLQGESTGHVDMFAAFLEPDLILIGRYDPAVDAENAARLDQLATELQDTPTLDGPLQVARIPMPDHDDGVWRTYTNIVFANGVLLVPVYPNHCPQLDQRALNLYRRLLPDRHIVGIDCSDLIRMNGALRCITMNVPRGLPLRP